MTPTAYPRMSEPLRIVVSGLAGLYPVGGVAWDYLQYVVGLAGLGHDVVYHEDTWTWPFHPVERRYTDSGEYSARFLDAFFRRYAPGLRSRWHYLHLHETSFGMAQRDFDRFAATADLWINVSGASMLPDGLSPDCVKVFLDTDPGYNQIVLEERFSWSENVDRWCESVAAHDRYFTYAENIDGADCRMPAAGYAWRPTRMPIVLDLWPCSPAPPARAPWTTVMTWNAFKGRLIHDGVEYGSKETEFERLITLPEHTNVSLSVAVGGVDAPLERLSRHGWSVQDGPKATLTPRAYKRFIRGSRGELSAAKNVYVALRTGWFSCRSACYLAAGRPVVVQDTGFSSIFPIGEGVLAFRTFDEAVDAIRRVESEYDRHARAARAFAESFFDSRMVLRRLVRESLG